MSTPTKTGIYKNNDDDVLLLYSRYVRRLRHPELLALCRRQGQMGRLFGIWGRERVLRAIRQADLQYEEGGNWNGKGIHNAYGLIYAMCRDGLDDTLLRERESGREQERGKQRLRELKERGCLSCGYFDVGWDGYCYDCRKNSESTAKEGQIPLSIAGAVFGTMEDSHPRSLKQSPGLHGVPRAAMITLSRG